MNVVVCRYEYHYTHITLVWDKQQEALIVRQCLQVVVTSLWCTHDVRMYGHSLCRQCTRKTWHCIPMYKHTHRF